MLHRGTNRITVAFALISSFALDGLPEAGAVDIYLRASNWQYVVAENGGGGAVNANRLVTGPWETFALHDLDGGALASGHRVTFRTYDGHYLQAENGGGLTARMLAAGQTEGQWEIFVLERIAGPGLIQSGDLVSLRNSTWYAVAESGGGSVVNVNRTSVGEWEKFTFVQVGSSALRYFGYWRESAFGNRVPDIQDHANFSMSRASDFPGTDPQPDVLASEQQYGVSDYSVRGYQPVGAWIIADDADDIAWAWCSTHSCPNGRIDGWRAMKAQWETTIQNIRSQYPNAHPYINLSGAFYQIPGIETVGFPVGLDWVGFECYWGVTNPNTNKGCSTMIDFLTQRSMFRSEHRIWVLPPGTLGYGAHPLNCGSMSCAESWLVANAQAMYDWAKTDSRIIGMNVFVYNNSYVDPPDRAVEGIPSLLAKYRQIGQAITGRTDRRTLTVTLAGPGSGLSSVNSTPAGLACADFRCTGTFPHGTQVTLQAVPGPNTYFVNFTGDTPCSSGSLVMNQNYNCAANFNATTAVLMQQRADLPGFGSGADGSVTVSSRININAQSIAVGRVSADGIAYRVLSDPTGQTTITTTVSPDGIAPGDMILLINLQGSPTSSVGYYDLLNVIDVSGNTISVSTAPTHNYTGGSFANQQVVVQRIPQYSDMNIANGGVITAGAWDGLSPQPTGWVNTGIVAFAVQGALTIDPGGMIDVNALGYRGAPGESGLRLNGRQGEGLCGTGIVSTAENCGAGGGGTTSFSGGWYGAGGGSAGHANAGDSGSRDSRDTTPVTTPGSGGARYGQTDLSNQLFFGSGGGAGGNYDNGLIESTAPGGAGGGIAVILANSFSNQGVIQSDGHDAYWVSNTLSGGAGSGGSILIEAADAALGNNLIRAHGATTVGALRFSSVGTISVFYSNSVSGSAY